MSYWSRRGDLNPRPTDYESVALPLSYAGLPFIFNPNETLTHSTAPNPVFEGRVEKRRSELALSEVEGVNPEQAPAFRLGSRRVDSFLSCFILVVNPEPNHPGVTSQLLLPCCIYSKNESIPKSPPLRGGI